MVQEEKAALEQQLAEEKHSPESCFIEAAIQELKVRGALETDWMAGVSYFSPTFKIKQEMTKQADWLWKGRAKWILGTVCS